MRRSDSGRNAPGPRFPGWIVPPILLTAVGVGVYLVLNRPVHLFGAVLTILFGATLLWIAASVFWPAHADRTCPQCGGRTLERLDPTATHGLACGACGWRDEAVSSFLLAEEEGPLEAIVLRERRERERERRRRRAAARAQKRAAAPPRPHDEAPDVSPPGTRPTLDPR